MKMQQPSDKNKFREARKIARWMFPERNRAISSPPAIGSSRVHNHYHRSSSLSPSRSYRNSAHLALFSFPLVPPVSRRQSLHPFLSTSSEFSFFLPRDGDRRARSQPLSSFDSISASPISDLPKWNAIYRRLITSLRS